MSRPYRSHKIPACDACRKRKRRCDIDGPETTCKLCRRLGRDCLFAANDDSTEAISAEQTTPSRVNASGRSPLSERVRRETTPVSVVGDEGLSVAKSALFVGPTVAEDVHVLENYLNAESTSHQGRVTPYTSVAAAGGDGEDTIVYVTVPRSRTGLRMAQDPGKAQLMAMQQILGQLEQDELISLFTKFIHPHFPIVDFQGGKDAISDTLMCYIYALALHLWNKSPALAQRSPPDSTYISNLAVAALQNDFMAPTTTTITAAILDLLGRPVKSVTTNILTIAKTVALSHSIGLHRDPTYWDCSREEKSLRKRLWWSVVIHDRWGSYAHGTPPIISSDRYDVAILDPEDWAPVHTDSSKTVASCTQFCFLTRCLSELLDLIHGLRTSWEHVPKVLRRVECDLDTWESELCRLCQINPRQGPPSGFCSLWLDFLSVKVLLQRLYLRSATLRTPIENEKQYRIASLRESAIAIVDYINDLSPAHFAEFWFSYSAHILVSTTIMLLRCMIETTDAQALHRCRSKLSQFLQTLQYAKTDCGWDIADMCLERCSGAIERVLAGHANRFGEREDIPAEPHGGLSPPLPGLDILDAEWLAQSVTGLDALLPAESLDQIWDHMEPLA